MSLYVTVLIKIVFRNRLKNFKLISVDVAMENVLISFKSDN